MDITSIIEIIIVIAVIYLVIKFIVNPVIKIILGIIIFLVAVYVLQRFFGFNINEILAPFGISLNMGKWAFNFNDVLWPANTYIDKLRTFGNLIWQNMSQTLNQNR